MWVGAGKIVQLILVLAYASGCNRLAATLIAHTAEPTFSLVCVCDAGRPEGAASLTGQGSAGLTA